MDYPLPASQRRCHASGRDLQPGEPYYGVVLNGPSGLTRHDFAAESWPGPPEKAIGFWSGVVPPTEGPRRMPINDDAIRESFLNLENDETPSQVNFRYVLALLMIRRKRLKLEGMDSDPVGPVLRLVDPKTGDRHQVRDPQLNEAELTSAQEEVFRVLGWNS